MNTQTLDLDLSKDGLGGNLVRVGQGDKSGTTIKALIYDGGGEVSLSGYTAYLEVLLPNKRNYYRAAATVSGNAATVTVDESKLCSIPGYTDEAYFSIEKNGVRCSTERFAIEILRCATYGQQPAQSWDDAVDSLITRGNAAVSAANAAAGSASAAASAATSAAAEANARAGEAGKAASSANSAAKAANDAASAANSAADGANKAKDAAYSAAGNATSAASSASDAASSAAAAAGAANAAAAAASGAAEDANAAAQNALNIANSIAAAKPPQSGEVEEIMAAAATLATAVADLQDGYVIIGEAAYMPASRKSGMSGESVTVAQASASGETATLN